MFSVASSRMNQGCSRKWSKVKPTRLHRLGGLELAEAQLGLAGADVAVGLEQHPRVERLLVAEVVVEHALVGAGLLGDTVDAGAVEAELDELRRAATRMSRRVRSGSRARRPGDGGRRSSATVVMRPLLPGPRARAVDKRPVAPW